MLTYTPSYVFFNSNNIYFSQKCSVFQFLSLCRVSPQVFKLKARLLFYFLFYNIILSLASFNKGFKDILFDLFFNTLALSLALLVLGIEAPSALKPASALILWLKAIINSFPFNISIFLLFIIDITYSNKYRFDPLFSFKQSVRVIVEYSS